MRVCVCVYIYTRVPNARARERARTCAHGRENKKVHESFAFRKIIIRQRTWGKAQTRISHNRWQNTNANLTQQTSPWLRQRERESQEEREEDEVCVFLCRISIIQKRHDYQVAGSLKSSLTTTFAKTNLRSKSLWITVAKIRWNVNKSLLGYPQIADPNGSRRQIHRR